MKKWKITGAIVMILLIAAAGAILPVCIHLPQDSVENQIPLNFQDMQTETQRTPLTTTEKMNLLVNNSGQIVRVEEDSMIHTGQVIIESVKAQIQQYADMGYFSPNLSYVNGQVYPIMVFVAETGEQYDYFWEVKMVYVDEQQELNIYCVVDDERANIYSLYMDKVWQDIFLRPTEYYVGKFTEAFLGKLGISDFQKIYDEQHPFSILYAVPSEGDTQIALEAYGGCGSLRHRFSMTAVPLHKENIDHSG